MRSMPKRRLTGAVPDPNSINERAGRRGSSGSWTLAARVGLRGAKAPRRIKCCGSDCRMWRLGRRRRVSPGGEAHCSCGAGAIGNEASWRECRRRSFTILASRQPNAGRKSTSRAGADSASFSVEWMSVAHPPLLWGRAGVGGRADQGMIECAAVCLSRRTARPPSLFLPRKGEETLRDDPCVNSRAQPSKVASRTSGRRMGCR